MVSSVTSILNRERRRAASFRPNGTDHSRHAREIGGLVVRGALGEKTINFDRPIWVSHTKRPAWALREERHVANRRARASRKANRP